MISSSHYTITKNSRNFLATSIGISIFFILLGILAIYLIGNRVDRIERERFLVRVQNAAILIEPNDVLALSGTESDIDSPAYKKLKEKMFDLGVVNTDARFTYLMGLSGDKLFFYVDSEQPNSPDYSAPGDIYEETLPIEVLNFKSGTPFVEGPYTDGWGRWVSAYAPVVDPVSGSTIAIIGMDISADYWTTQILYIRLVTGLVTLLICGFLIVLMLYLRNSVGNIELLHKDNETLRASKEYLLETESIVHLGRWNLNLMVNELSWNDQMFSIFGISENMKITPDTFFDSIHPEDLKQVKDAFENATKGGKDSFDILYRILVPNMPVKKILSVCSVRKNPKGAIFRIIGTAQDVSNFSITRL